MSIDVAGMIQNMLHGGFTLTSCISELIDNSLGAGATQIRMSIEGNVLYYCDNGNGMDKEGLRLSNIFHLRGESIKTKHGRFGIGGKQAYVQLSDKQLVTIYSKVEHVNMIELDYRRFIAENEMQLHVSEIGMSSLPVWEKYSFGKGTLFVIQSTPDIVKQLKDLIECKNETNLIYHLGLTYKAFLSKCSIEIVTDKSYPVLPIDVLLWDTIRQRYYNSIHVYSDGLKVIFEYSNNDKSVWRDFSDSKTGKEKTFLLGNLKLVGTIDIRATYHEDWRKVMVLPNKDCTQEEFERFNGKFILRNNKVVTQIASKKKVTGDLDIRDTELNSHTMIWFQANEIMDTLFGVQINKSQLNIGTIHEHLWLTVEHIIKQAVKMFNEPIISARPKADTRPYSQDNTRPYGQNKTQTKAPESTTSRAASIPEPKTKSTPTVEPPKTTEVLMTTELTTEPAPTVEPPKTANPRLAKVEEPAVPIALRPAPADIVFSKADRHIMINDTKKKKMYQIAYLGQYHLHYGSLEDTYSKLGYTKFIEYITELEKLNRFLS